MLCNGEKISFPVHVIAVDFRCVRIKVVLFNIFSKLTFRLKGFLQKKNHKTLIQIVKEITLTNRKLSKSESIGGKHEILASENEICF